MALQHKFGGENKRELQELSYRVEKANESLHDFAMEVDRLVQPA